MAARGDRGVDKYRAGVAAVGDWPGDFGEETGEDEGSDGGVVFDAAEGV